MGKELKGAQEKNDVRTQIANPSGASPLRGLKKLNIIGSRIGLKLLVPYFIVSLLTLGLMVGLIYFNYSTQMDFVRQIQEEISTKASSKIDSYISTILSDLELISSNINDINNTEDNEGLIKSLMEVNPSIYEIAIVNVSGNEVSKIIRYNPAASKLLEDVSTEEIFTEVLRGEYSVGDYYMSEYQIPFMSIGFPIKDAKFNLIGAVLAEVDLSPMWNIISTIRVRDTGYAYVVDSKGYLIMYKEVTLVKRNLDLKHVEGVSNFLEKRNGESAFETYMSFGSNVIGNWKAIKTTDWGVIVELPLKEVYGDMLPLFIVAGLSLISSVLFVVIILTIILRKILRPLGYLQEGVLEIRKGNLDYQIQFESDDEIGGLATTFNEMTKNIVKNITERKQVEGELRKHREHLEELVKERTSELEEMSRHKSEFLGSMSHELRTPLNSIIGYTKLMLDGLEGDINEEQQRDLQTVHNNSKHLLELINGLLDLSKIEAGKIVFSYEAFTISDFLSEVIPGIEQLAREKGLTLTYDVAPNTGSLHADKAKTKQVLINILGNAIKFTNEGSVKLNVSETNSDFIFSVTDTGIGIKDEDLETVFDSFKQVGPAQIAGYEGTGLGLAISKRFIEMQGGKIWAESEFGKGTTFTFTLPRKKVASS